MISLGIDIGGTGCKCVAFRDNGEQITLSYREYPTKPGEVNLDALALRESVFFVISDCVRKLEDPKDVAAITVSSFGESFVPVDKDGQPLTDIILYFANTESGAFTDLVNSIGAEKFMRITCVLPDASYSLAKMLYSLKAAPRPVWKFLFIASYICFCLSGESVADYSLACRSILFDVRKLCWSDELTAACGIDPATLPTVLPTGSCAGTLLPEVASQLGLPQSVKVVIGSHDQIVNALGCGVAAPGDAVDITGTVECICPLFASIPETLDFERENYACVPYLDGKGYVTYAYNISGGAVVRWYRDSLAFYLKEAAKQRGCSVYDILNETCPAEPTGLIVLPFLQGMGGTPDVLTGARGTIYGLSMHTTPADIYRAILEGLTFEMQYNLEKLAKYNIHPTKLFAAGGGANSPVWRQIKADSLNAELLPALAEEAATEEAAPADGAFHGSATTAEAWHGGYGCNGPRGGYDCYNYGPGCRGWDDDGRWHRGWHGGWHRGNCPYYYDEERYGDRDDRDYRDEGPRGYYRDRDWDDEGPRFTPEQRKTLEKLVDDFNAKAEPLRDQLFVKRSELRALENSTNADQAAVEKTAREFLDLRNQLRDLHDKLVQDMEKAGLYR